MEPFVREAWRTGGFLPEEVAGSYRRAVEEAWRKVGALPGRAEGAPEVLVVEEEPLEYLAGIAAAQLEGAGCWLGNPGWRAEEWQAFRRMARPDLELGTRPGKPGSGPAPGGGVPCRPGEVRVATSGSTGRLRFARHTWETLSAAALGLARFLEAPAGISSLCVLPLWHVSGLMQAVRAVATGGRLALVPWNELEAGQWPDLDVSRISLSLVPTQLRRLLGMSWGGDFLGAFQMVLMGGAATSFDQLEKARALRLPLALSYGMTETAALVTLLPVEAFRTGYTGAGYAMPHAQVRTAGTASQPGPIELQAQSLFLGYHDGTGREARAEEGATGSWWRTGDGGYYDRRGILYLSGRMDRMINTGGEKVFPEEVEGVLGNHPAVKEAAVCGIPDAEWGERVAAAVVVHRARVRPADLTGWLSQRLAVYKVPKQVRLVLALPRTGLGKIDYAALREMLQVEGIDLSEEEPFKLPSPER